MFNSKLQKFIALKVTDWNLNSDLIPNDKLHNSTKSTLTKLTNLPILTSNFLRFKPAVFPQS